MTRALTYTPVVPPLEKLYDEGAERAVLGSLIANPRVAALLDAIQPRDFFALGHVLIFEAIRAVSGRGETPDITRVVGELVRGGELGDRQSITLRVSECIQAAARPDEIAAYAVVVREYAYRRRVLEAADDIRRTALDLEKPVLEVRAEVERTVTETQPHTGARVTVAKAFDLMNAYAEHIEATQHLPAGVTGQTTGLNMWDELLDGLQPASFNVVAGRPGQGKSSLIMGLAMHVAKRGGRIYYASMEMPHKQLMERMFATETGISTYKLRRGLRKDGMTPQQWTTFIEALKRLGKNGESLPILFDDSASLLPSVLKAEVEIARREGELAVIIVDYLQLMSGDGTWRANDRVNELGSIARALKNLAMSVGTPIVAAAQLNRDVEKRALKEPTLADLRESGEIENSADTVSFIWTPNEEEYPETRCLTVAKNRHGGTGRIALRFEGQYTRFWDAPQWQEIVEGV